MRSMASRDPRITMLHAPASAIPFLTSIVCGYSGLGFSILAITALSLIYRPTQIVAFFKRESGLDEAARHFVTSFKVIGRK